MLWPEKNIGNSKTQRASLSRYIGGAVAEDKHRAAEWKIPTELGNVDLLLEGIRVSGLMEIGIGSTVTASAKNPYAIECFGVIEANISTVSGKKDADVFCSGAVVNFGAEIDTIGGIHNRN